MIKHLVLIALTLSIQIKGHSSEGSTYSFDWLDTDKEVYVLQNRKFRKENHFYLNLGLAYTLSGAFVNGTGFQGRAGYFFWEEWGLEILYSKNSGKENNTAKMVRPKDQSSPGSVPFRRITESYGGVMAMWSPFYSKMNLFNTIAYYDWIIGLGLVSLNEKNNGPELDPFNPSDGEVKESHSGILLDLAWQFYVLNNWQLRFDVLGVLYSANGVGNNEGKKVAESHWDMTMSFGYRF